MKINTINYFIVDALKSIKRNKTISIAAMLTVLITFFIFGTFTLLALNFNKAIEDVAEGVEIQVFLLNDIKLVDQREIEITLREQPGVKDVIYESKDEAFLNLKESLAENEGLLQGYDLSNNPLPSSFIVKLNDASQAEAVGKAIEGLTGVESIKNQQDLINTISSFVRVVQIIGVGLFIIFVGVSVFLIMNTIKLTVYSRRREVGIMKFVGATDWFIRWPFIIEGVIIGAIGSLLSIAVLYYAYKAVFEWIISSMYIASIIQPQLILSTLLWMFLGGGIIVGAIGSTAALRKFLVV
jgi:cell division transport system permease protein